MAKGSRRLWKMNNGCLTPLFFLKTGPFMIQLQPNYKMLVHPFREGNGRLGRLLATLMALQAGLPVLDFSELDGARREEYFAAVRAGMDMNYQPMKRLFNDVIERSLQTSQEP